MCNEPAPAFSSREDAESRAFVSEARRFMCNSRFRGHALASPAQAHSPSLSLGNELGLHSQQTQVVPLPLRRPSRSPPARYLFIINAHASTCATLSAIAATIRLS